MIPRRSIVARLISTSISATPTYGISKPLAAIIVSHAHVSPAYGNRCCMCCLKKLSSTIDTWLPESSKQSTETPPIVALMTGWGQMVRVIRCLTTGEPCSPEPTTELIAVGPAENPAAVEDQVWQRHLAFASDSPSSCVLASGSNNIRHGFPVCPLRNPALANFTSRSWSD